MLKINMTLKILIHLILIIHQLNVKLIVMLEIKIFLFNSDILFVS